MSRVRSYIVGIAGGSASGKSTFTHVLLEALASTCPEAEIVDLHTDRYFRVGSPDMPTFVSPSSGKTVPDYNHPDTMDRARLVVDLDALAEGEDAPDVIIVEGHFVLCFSELRERFDLRTFIELDADARALRRMVRNLARHGDPLDEQTPAAIATYFLESAKVGHERYIEPSRVHADLIVRGDGDFSRSAPMVAAIIRSGIESSEEKAA
jgi:uridine kinase